MKTFSKRQIEIFNKYIVVQMSGRYNMITEADTVAAEIGCSKEEYLFTVNNYSALRTEVY